MKKCLEWHFEYCSQAIPIVRKIEQYIEQIYGLSVAVLGRSQVGFRLRDHFATTVAHLWASCVLSVAFLVSLFSFPFSEDHRPLAEGIKTAQEEREKKTSADIPART